MARAWAGGGGNNGGSPAAQRWRAGRARSARAASMTARGRCSRCRRREVWQQSSSAALAGQPRASAQKRQACQRGAGRNRGGKVGRAGRQVYGRKEGASARALSRRRAARPGASTRQQGTKAGRHGRRGVQIVNSKLFARRVHAEMRVRDPLRPSADPGAMHQASSAERRGSGGAAVGAGGGQRSCQMWQREGPRCQAVACGLRCADGGAQGAEAKTVPKAQRMGAVFAVAACVTPAALGLFFWHLFCLAAFVTA